MKMKRKKMSYAWVVKVRRKAMRNLVLHRKGGG